MQKILSKIKSPVMLRTRKAWVCKGQKNGKRMLWSRFNLEGNKTFFIVLVRFGNNSKMYVSTSTALLKWQWLKKSGIKHGGQPVLVQPRRILRKSLLPISVMTKGSNPLSLLQNQDVGFGPGCLKTGCPLISVLQSFQQLYGWNQFEKLVKMIYSMSFSEQNQPICHSSWGW